MDAELRDLIRFYRTPTGKKLIDSTPKIFAESMRLSNEHLVPKLAPIIEKLLKEEMKFLLEAPPQKRKVT